MYTGHWAMLLNSSISPSDELEVTTCLGQTCLGLVGIVSFCGPFDQGGDGHSPPFATFSGSLHQNICRYIFHKSGHS